MTKDRRNAELAKQAYKEALKDSELGRRLWREARIAAERAVTRTLRETRNLTQISPALQRSGAHSRVLRSLLAPPVSQDQFGYIVDQYSKSAEKHGSPLREEAAEAIAQAFERYRDRELTPWIDAAREATSGQVNAAVARSVTLVAHQEYGTHRRSALALEQKTAVIASLRNSGWQPADVPEGGDEAAGRNFNVGTFIQDMRPEKDLSQIEIACRIQQDKFVAVECQVTNDATNSAKRISNFIGKVTEWRAKWRTEVVPAIVLEGVINLKEVRRLRRRGAMVFWSHDLNELEDWMRSLRKSR